MSSYTNGFIAEASENREPRKRKILVTGGAGFIGCHTAKALLDRGDDVVIVDEVNDYYDPRFKYANLHWLQSAFTPERVKVYVRDLCDSEFLDAVFTKEKPDLVCHLAARAGVRPSIDRPELYVHSNILATTYVFEMCRRHNIKHCVWASSSSIYGGIDAPIFTETLRTDQPVSPYAATKRACELMSYTYYHLYKFNVTGLRFFTVYGPRGRPDMAPFKFLDRVYRGHTIDQFGDGSTSRDYTYVDDIVSGVVAALDRPNGYKIYNLGSSRPFLLSKFIQIVEETVGKKAIINVLPPQPGDVDRTYADITSSTQDLGYRPHTRFEDGLKATFDWYLSEYVKITNSKDTSETYPVVISNDSITPIPRNVQ
eukprot:CAMPEP_0184643752 /NCGR_PEP_ID=MMETSP0308-20130426/582_1 /TAXON_ID=38269 /ORGANISM="Gloeochaete witrockiana, Strain SAG 46.84" /LENGTH=368 /DNA_ID=CAMNT_0027071901 /DNA_START=217 /DNA_END=1323 /DNA_ORIENTATION=+